MIQRMASWSLDEQDARQIRELLGGFLRESGAGRALLVDRAGQLILTAGEPLDFDATAFASLAAADFSANDQLASMIGEPEFSSFFHQGERESIYLADVAGRAILVVLFDQRATLGMVRIQVRNLVRELTGVFHQLLRRPAASAGALEPTWAEEAEDEIDRIFGSW